MTPAASSPLKYRCALLRTATPYRLALSNLAQTVSPCQKNELIEVAWLWSGLEEKSTRIRSAHSVENGRSLTKNAPAALTSAVSLLIQGSPGARTKIGKLHGETSIFAPFPDVRGGTRFNSSGMEFDCIPIDLMHAGCHLPDSQRKRRVTCVNNYRLMSCDAQTPGTLRRLRQDTTSATNCALAEGNSLLRMSAGECRIGGSCRAMLCSLCSTRWRRAFGSIHSLPAR